MFDKGRTNVARRVAEEKAASVVSQGGPSREARMLKRALALDVGDANPLEYDSARVDRAAKNSGASALRTLTIPTMEDMGPPSVQVREQCGKKLSEWPPFWRRESEGPIDAFIHARMEYTTHTGQG